MGEYAGVKVMVCAKQIPDPAQPGRLDPATATLVRDGRLVLDEADATGVELALQLVDAAGGGEVVVVSMAPRGERGGVRTALAMGADRAILVSDDVLAGSDALGTAKVLAAVARRAGPDLVVAATESTDGYTGTMPVQLAELLGLPSVTFATRVHVAGGRVAAQRRTVAGFDEVTCPLPAVVTVVPGMVEPRYPSFDGIMAARAKPIEHVTAADVGIDPGDVGWAGARQRIVAVRPAEERRAGEMVDDEHSGAERIVRYLERLGVV